MKILTVLDHEFPPDLRVENEMEALIQAGHELHLACYTRQNRPAYEEINGVKIHRKPISVFLYKSSVGALKFPFYFHFWKHFLESLFRQEHFDAIHIHDLPLARVGLRLAKQFSIPCTLDLHENWPALLKISAHTQTILGKLLSSHRQWVRYEKESCAQADHVIVVVEEAKQRLTGLGIHPEKISIVSNTLNFNHFKIPEEHPDPSITTLLYAGGITPHRGLQHAIRGMKYLKNSTRPVQLLILGEGSYLNTLKQLALEENVSKEVHFLGWKNYDEMQYYFGKSDICLIPHQRNPHTDSTIPHKLFQYMYAGKPVVASDCLPIRRIVEKTGCGLIYPFDNSKAFARCIEKLTADKDFYSRCALNGKKAVETTYHWGKDSRNLCAIYGKSPDDGQ
jgi:glycosyltransferase involved in cell wall biosynthesis